MAAVAGVSGPETTTMQGMSRFDPRSLVRRIRRNHALEHATIHVLAESRSPATLVGRSDWAGFSLLGAIDTASVERATHQALARLRAGEHHLAVHPRCGTIFATTGVLSGLAVFATLALAQPRGRPRLASLPDAILAATAAALLAHPLGMWVERTITTSGDIGDLTIARIYRQPGRAIPIHRIDTR
jgi:hypothetical protein